MAERSRPTISLDDLETIAETQVSDLDRLGLAGLPSALEAYGITDQDKVTEIIQAVAKIAFRQISAAVHPDVVDQEQLSETSLQQFRLVLDAIKRINADPSGSLRQLILKPSTEDRARIGNIKELGLARQLNEHIGELRRQKVELLYMTPYKELFGLADGEELHLDVSPRSFQYYPDDFVLRIPDPTTTSAEIAVSGNKLEVRKLKLFSQQADANLGRLKKAAAANPSFFDNMGNLINETFNQARIIGAVKSDVSPFPSTDLTDPDELTKASSVDQIMAGHVTANPLALVYNDPRKFDLVDHITPRIPRPGEEVEGYELVLAVKDGNEYKVGLLGSYARTPKKQTAVVEL